MKYPPISCKCITYGRISTLEELVYSFINLEYEGEKELIIVNDYPLQKIIYDHPEIKIYNLDYTFPTIGHKENYALEKCNHNIIAIFDDDDVVLPNHLNNIAKYFKEDTTLLHWGKGILFDRPKITAITSLGNGGIVYSKKAWRDLGGHPLENAGYDMTFVMDLQTLPDYKLVIAEPPNEEVSYIYYWSYRSYHMSGLGSDKDNTSRPNALIRHSEYVESQRLLGNIPTGDVILNPRWEVDYIDLHKKFVESIAN